jgi:hypothetical protein
MFLKQNQLANSSRNVYYLFKRNYNLKKLTTQIDKNPHLKKVFDEQSKKKERQGVLKHLVDKR